MDKNVSEKVDETIIKVCDLVVKTIDEENMIYGETESLSDVITALAELLAARAQ